MKNSFLVLGIAASVLLLAACSLVVYFLAPSIELTRFGIHSNVDGRTGCGRA